MANDFEGVFRPDYGSGVLIEINGAGVVSRQVNNGKTISVSNQGPGVVYLSLTDVASAVDTSGYCLMPGDATVIDMRNSDEYINVIAPVQDAVVHVIAGAGA